MKKEEILQKIEQEKHKMALVSELFSMLNNISPENDYTDYTDKYIYICIIPCIYTYMHVDKQEVINGKLILHGCKITESLYLNPNLCSITFENQGNIEFKIDKLAKNIIKVLTKEEFIRHYNNIVKSLQNKKFLNKNDGKKENDTG